MRVVQVEVNLGVVSDAITEVAHAQIEMMRENLFWRFAA